MSGINSSGNFAIQTRSYGTKIIFANNVDPYRRVWAMHGYLNNKLVIVHFINLVKLNAFKL